jgi:hypothetical protein
MKLNERPTRNVNSFLEVLPQLDQVHVTLACIVESLRESETAAAPDCVAAVIKGATGDKVRPFLLEMVRIGVMQWDEQMGYAVTGFGVEALTMKSPQFEEQPYEARRRSQEAADRIEIATG